MQISEQELRDMIRAPLLLPWAAATLALRNCRLRLTPDRSCTSIQPRPVLVTGTSDGACVIEPDHRCDHCGYCKSLGH
jgi:hypothetical protein